MVKLLLGLDQLQQAENDAVGAALTDAEFSFTGVADLNPEKPTDARINAMNKEIFIFILKVN